MLTWCKIRRGFTAIEIILTLGTLALTTSLAIPTYRDYLVRNDLEIARQNISQGLQRAQFLSQVAMNDACWGFSTDSVPGRGVLFMCGESAPYNYATRNTDFDELYTLPSSISVQGITEITYEKISGIPSQAGTITLTALNGEQRTINVTIGDEGNVEIPEDWLDICVNPYGASPTNMTVPDSLWEYYQGQGALIGVCSESATTCGNGVIETLEQCDDGNTSDGDGCDSDCQTEWEDGDDVNCVANSEDGVDCDSGFDCDINVVHTRLDIAGYDQNITVQYKGATGWTDWWGSWNKAVDGNINCDSGIGPNCSGPLPEIASCGSFVSADEVRFKVTSWEKKQFWYDGTDNNHWKKLVFINTASGDHPNIYVLSDGDPIPNHTPLQDVGSITPALLPYVDLVNGVMNMPNDYAVWLFELDTNSPDIDSDFQDLVIVMDFKE